MKRINLPLIAILALFGSLMLASCKKDHTCACTVGYIIYDTVINFEIEDQKTRQAKRLCENNESTIKTYTAALLNSLIAGSTPDSSFPFPITITPNLITAECELK